MKPIGLLALVACGSVQQASVPAADPHPRDAIAATPSPPPADEPVAPPADGPVAPPAAPTSPRRPPIAVTGDLAVLAELPAWAMVTAADRVVVIDEGFSTTTAIDATAGKQAWHVQIEREARGRHTLHAGPSTILEWAGGQLHVLDPARGTEMATTDAPYNGAAWNDGGCGLDVEHGMCAWRCQCSYQVVDCATGKRAGKRYDKQYVELFPHDGPPSAGCWGAGSSTIGRAGNLALFSTEDISDPATQRTSHPSIGGGTPITAAIDLASGAEAWRMLFAASSLASQSGISADHKSCWLAGLNDVVRVVDCAKGTTRWQTEAAQQPATRFFTSFVAPHALFELRDRRATLYDLPTGKQRWRVTLPAGTLGWPRGVAPVLDWRIEDVTAIAILDPASGKTIATIARPPGAGITPDHDGGVLLSGTQLEHYDRGGALVAHAGISNVSIVLGTRYALAITPAELIVLALSDLHELGRIAGTYQDIVVEGPLGAQRAALFAYDGKVPGRAILVRLGQ